MKLFNRSVAIPKQTAPNYDYIRKVENELRMDDEGFNERFDESLIEDYKTRRDSEAWSTEQRNEEVKKLSASLTSFRWKMVSVKQTIRIENVLRSEKYGPGFTEACEGLRQRMMRPRGIDRNT